MAPSLPTIQPDDEAAAGRADGEDAFEAPAPIAWHPSLFDYLLRLGDDSLVLGQRLTEWCGHAPALEIDLSLANMGLDLIGQATLLLDYAGKVEGAGRDADALAFHRDAPGFRNCLLVEQPNGDFAQTMARQLLFSLHQSLAFDALTRSADPHLAAIAAKSIKEIRYHVDLAADWVIRLGDGTAESHERTVEGFDWFWRFVGEMFTADDAVASLAAAGLAPDYPSLRAEFDRRLAAVLREATVPLPTYPRGATGGRSGHHSEHLGHLLATMQHIPRSYPQATW